MIFPGMSLKKIRAAVLEITPLITGILDEVEKISKMRLDPKEATETQGTTKGIEIVKEYIDMLFMRQYDSIVKIIAALYGISPDEMEEKTLPEITEMIRETLSSKVLMSFFPRLRGLARKTQSDT